MVSVVPVVPVEVPLMVPDKHMAVKLVLAFVVGPFETLVMVLFGQYLAFWILALVVDQVDVVDW